MRIGIALRRLAPCRLVGAPCRALRRPPRQSAFPEVKEAFLDILDDELFRRRVGLNKNAYHQARRLLGDEIRYYYSPLYQPGYAGHDWSDRQVIALGIPKWKIPFLRRGITVHELTHLARHVSGGPSLLGDYSCPRHCIEESVVWFKSGQYDPIATLAVASVYAAPLAFLTWLSNAYLPIILQPLWDLLGRQLVHHFG